MSSSPGYLTKLGLSAELLAPAGKFGRSENRSMLEVAQDFASSGDAEDLAIWRAFCEGIRGARMLTWSRGLRQFAGLDPEKSDEELIEETIVSQSTVHSIDAPTWRIVRNIPFLPAAVLEYAEIGGSVAVAALLESAINRHLTRSGGLLNSPP